MKFRYLTSDEVDCRVSTVSEKGCSLLLYKDARCDMNILDESVGATNWQRSHTRDNANCIVSIGTKKKNNGCQKRTQEQKATQKKKKVLLLTALSAPASIGASAVNCTQHLSFGLRLTMLILNQKARATQHTTALPAHICAWKTEKLLR